MRMHRKTVSRKASLWVIVLASSPFLSGEAMAQVRIFDPSGLAQLRNTVTTAQNQLVELNQIRDLGQQQLDAIGRSGSLGGLFTGGASTSLGTQSSFYEAMSNFAFDPCAVNLCQVGNNPVGTTDINEAKEWANTNFFASGIITPSQELDLREIRRRGAVNAAVNAVALANITHNDLAGAGGQADALEQIVSSSQDLRGDIRANSAIALASYKIELQQLAMLTSLLEVQAMESINNAPIYHEDGGTEFADAYIETDFSTNDGTTRVRVTPPRQGSAGGRGLGGALIQSLSSGDAVGNILQSSGAGQNLPQGLSGLSQSIASGALPTVLPENMTMTAVVADAASLTQRAARTSGQPTLVNATGLVQTGMASGTLDGRIQALLGMAQAHAATSGQQTLSAALGTGAAALTSGNNTQAIAFANGAIRDLQRNGVQGENIAALRQGIAGVESGTVAPSALILDASTLLATFGSERNTTSASLLQVDPGAAGEDFYRMSFADVMRAIAGATNNQDLAGAAQTLSTVSQQDVDSLRSVMQQNAIPDRN